jgi:hypothetical protein
LFFASLNGSASEVMMLMIYGKNAVGIASGYAEVKRARINQRKALWGGAIVLLDDTWTSSRGSGWLSPATVSVNRNKANRTCSVSAEFQVCSEPIFRLREVLGD